MLAVAEEIDHCRAFEGSLAVVMLRGAGSSRNGYTSGSSSFERALRPRDQISFFSSSIVELLLPGIALSTMRSLLSSVIDEQKLCAGAVLFPGRASSADEMISVSMDLPRQNVDRSSVLRFGRRGARFRGVCIAGKFLDEGASGGA